MIIIQMESFQNFLIGLKLDGQEITPNMNKLAEKTFTTTTSTRWLARVRLPTRKTWSTPRCTCRSMIPPSRIW